MKHGIYGALTRTPLGQGQKHAFEPTSYNTESSGCCELTMTAELRRGERSSQWGESYGPQWRQKAALCRTHCHCLQEVPKLVAISS